MGREITHGRACDAEPAAVVAGLGLCVWVEGVAGKLTYANGDVYEGEYKDDKQHGGGAVGRRWSGGWGGCFGRVSDAHPPWGRWLGPSSNKKLTSFDASILKNSIIIVSLLLF